VGVAAGAPPSVPWGFFESLQRQMQVLQQQHAATQAELAALRTQTQQQQQQQQQVTVAGQVVCLGGTSLQPWPGAAGASMGVGT
jgi:hypothetical protein